MAGHSKWSTIKRKKAAIDAKRGKAFSRLTKELSVAARTGGGDASANARLRLLMDKAKEINMPMENVTRAIKRGTGELPGVTYEEQTYEGYGPHGIAVIVETLTDNKNRTVADMRRLFSNKGGSLGETGAVNWMFTTLGVVRGTGSNISEDELLEQLIDYDVKDIDTQDNTVIVTCDPKSLDAVKEGMKAAGLTIESGEIERVAQNTADLEGSQAERAIQFLDELEEHDDVQNVYTNLA